MSEGHFAVKPLPWQLPQWQRLQQARKEERLPHALLLSGLAGTGKRHFAEALAHGLLCAQPGPEGQACGSCQACRLLKAGTHPDLQRVEPEEEGKLIRVDSIREMSERGALTAQAGGYKLVLLQPADAMNMAAANSLLKTLEEPPSWTLMLLVSDQPHRLPATIRSRCQTLAFPAPPPEQALEWLAGQGAGAQAELALSLSGGAPLAARELAEGEQLARRQSMLQEFLGLCRGHEDPVQLANRWHGTDAERAILWMRGWVTDLLRLKATPEPPMLFNADLREAFLALAQGLDSRFLFREFNRLLEAAAARHSQLNTQLMLESLLIPWAGRRPKT